MDYKKITIILILSIFMLKFSTAALEVQSINKGSVIIKELDNPAYFDLKIDNNGPADLFEIYSLISVEISPRNKFTLPTGESELSITARLDESLKKKDGFFTFEYQIQGDNTPIFENTLMVEVLPLEDVLEIKAKPLHPDESTITISVINTENAHLQNIKINFDSIFFSGSEYVTLAPFEEKNLTFSINKDVAERTIAGPYIISAEVETEDDPVELETLVQFLEKQGLSVEEKTDGFIIKEKTITKKNYGNVPAVAAIDVKKDILSRIFTSNNPEPISVAREGLSVVYHWEKEVSPAESYSITTTTNYTIPFILLILVVALGLAAKIYSTTPVVLNKRAQLVKTKHGEFALKVTLNVKAKKHIDKLQIVDSIPHMSKLYEKFGIPPTRIDPNSGRMYWNLDRLSKGESRVFSYIIYSKLNVVGRFELPTALASYEFEGKTQQSYSNKAFFVTEVAREN